MINVMKLTVDPGKKPRLYISESLQQRCDRLLDSYGISSDDTVIGLNPGAKYGASKCWPPEYFAGLAEMIAEKWDCKIMLFIGPGEQDLGLLWLNDSGNDSTNFSIVLMFFLQIKHSLLYSSMIVNILNALLSEVRSCMKS